MVAGVCGVYHDDAIYVSTAKALAEGQGYRLINFPGSPKQTKYPILYPAVLAIVWKLWPSFPQNLVIMQSLTLLIAAAAIGMCYLYLVQFGYFTRNVAMASSLLCITSPLFTYFSTNTLTEIPFLFLTILMLRALEKEMRAPSESPGREYFLGILLALPFLCRSVGAVFIIVGIIIWYLYGRSIRWLTLGAITVALPWILWVLIGLGEANQDSFTGYYTNYVNWWSQFGALSIGRVIAYNSMMVFLGTTNIAIGFIYYISSFLEFPIWLAMLSLLLGLISWFTVLLNNRQANLLRWFLISYLLIITLWPWPPSRFIVPILPFIIPNLLYGIWVMLRRLSFVRSSRSFIIAGFSVVLASNLILSYYQIKLNRHTHYNQPIRWGTKASWTAYEDIFKWIKSNSRPDDIIASGVDSMTYLYTGRRAFRPFLSNSLSLFYGMDSPATGTVKDLSQILKTYKPRYLVRTPMPGFGEEKPFNELLDKFIKKYTKSLIPIYVGADSRFIVFEVNINAIKPPVD
jgi:4-amino-4-deoxy-L-arabinose transferase-like glycosyltransferase